jgi:preprotein translocase subunit SecY
MLSSANKSNSFFNSGAFSKADDLKKRIWFVLIALVIYRIGAHIPIPGIDALVLKEIATKNAAGVLGMFNMLAGGSLERMTIFALAIMPYITASIIIQLMTVLSKEVEALKKEGESGRKKINQYTRYLTVILAAVQGFGIAVGLEAMNAPGAHVVIDPGVFFRITTVITLTTGTVFLMWLGEQITARGVGNGISMIIFAGIVSGLPMAVVSTLELSRTGALSGILVFAIVILVAALLFFVVFMERASRKIPVQYPKRQVGNKVYGGDSSHMPLKLNIAGVIPPIFASSILLFPLTIASFSSKQMGESFLDNIVLYLGHGKPLYILAYTALIIFFCFFYTAIVFNSQETAENLKKNGGIILGKRPGKVTAEYFDYVLSRLTVIGSAYIAFVCVIPEVLIAKFGIPFYLGGTSILIVVSVVMDTMVQIQTHLFAHQYEGLIKKMNISGKKT